MNSQNNQSSASAETPPAPPVDIRHVEQSDRGRYWADTDAGEAELTYSLGDDDLMIIAGTFVPRAARGAGVALALVKRAVEDAREQGRKIMPKCPYVDRVFDRYKDWADLRVPVRA